MKKVRFSVVVGMLICATTIFAQDPNFHIYLSFGQSNMEGQGTISTDDKTVISGYQQMYTTTCSGRIQGEWANAIPPLARCGTKLGPTDYFGRTLKNNLPDSIKIGVIVVAVAGCKIELFDKTNYQTYVDQVKNDPNQSWMVSMIDAYGGNPYQRLVDLGLKAKQDGVIKGILMHQGESNNGETTWPGKVKNVYDSLIADLGLIAEEVPLLAGEMLPGGSCEGHNTQIYELPKIIPNAHVVKAPLNTGAMPDGWNVHFTEDGYRKLGYNYAETILALNGYEQFFFEPECETVSENWNTIYDKTASNKAYVTADTGMQNIAQAPNDDANSISFAFTTTTDSAYHIYGRVNCATSDGDSFWIKIDDGQYSLVENITTVGWEWKKLSIVNITPGSHTVSIAYGENGALLDKICVKNTQVTPIGHIQSPQKTCTITKPVDPIVPTTIKSTNEKSTLGQNYSNPFNGKTIIPFELEKKELVSLKVYSTTGLEILELCGKELPKGKHEIEFNAENLPAGNYSYTLTTKSFSETKQMIIQKK